MKKLRILEEPLAVAIGQMLFLESFHSERINPHARWYRNEWVNTAAPAAFPIVKNAFANGLRLSDAKVVDTLAAACARTLAKTAQPTTIPTGQ